MTGRFLHQRGGTMRAHLIESSGLGGLRTLHAWSADYVHYFPRVTYLWVDSVTYFPHGCLATPIVYYI